MMVKYPLDGREMDLPYLWLEPKHAFPHPIWTNFALLSNLEIEVHARHLQHVGVPGTYHGAVLRSHPLSRHGP